MLLTRPIVARPLPMNPFEVLRTEMERFLDESLEHRAAGSPVVFPPVNAWQDDKALHVEAELPGFKPEEVEIAFENQTLTIRGSRGPVPTPEAATVLRKERWHGSFERSIRFTQPVDAENVAATLTNGILRIVLPKPVAAQPRKIAIRPATA